MAYETYELERVVVGDVPHIVGREASRIRLVEKGMPGPMAWYAIVEIWYHDGRVQTHPAHQVQGWVYAERWNT